jgi:hypothetical protein
VLDPDLQPCPICNPTTLLCNGGTNNGMSCTPASSALAAAFPTSHDCPVSSLVNIGSFPVGAELTTGQATATAAPTTQQQLVFCGYCRDADGTSAFGICTAGSNLGQVCSVHGDCGSLGVCGDALPCTSDANCTQPRESCQQRNQGAFGPNGGTVQTITLDGVPAGCLADGLPHPSTVVGGSCLAPSFNGIIDAAGDLPGPVALSLQGQVELNVESCGNGMLDFGEACDPPGVQAQCGAGELCKSDCQCTVPCDCCASNPGLLELTTGVAAGSCGTVLDSAGGPFRSLDCSGLYMGGGSTSFPPSAFFPDATKLTMSIAACDGATELLTLAAATAAQTGSNRNCTEPGCRFGPPVPIPNPLVVPTSLCAFIGVAADASGTATCEGAADISLPLTTALFLTGDMLPRRCNGGTNPGGRCTTVGADPLCTGGGTCVLDPDIQSCPICNPTTLVCNGGANNGAACTPASSPVGATYPTSHDCTVSSAVKIGDLPLNVAFTTGTSTRTAIATGPEPNRERVFCGYCRDADATGGFGRCESGPSAGQACGVPNDCGPGGTCGSLTPCTSDFDCAQPNERCEQRNQGAFGPNGGAAQTITTVGVPAGCLSDGLPHPSTLAGSVCLAPTMRAIMDQALDLPAPMALSLQGNAQLLLP